jgi:hypothetical protein
LRSGRIFFSLLGREAVLFGHQANEHIIVMDFSKLVDPIFMGVLLLSILVTLGLYILIYKVSSPANVVNPPAHEPQVVRNQPQRQNNLDENDEEDSDTDDETEQAQHGPRAGQAKMMGKKKRLKMERKAAMQEFRRYQLEQSKERQAEEKKRLKEVRAKEKADEKEAQTEDEAWQEYLRKKEEEEQKQYEAWKSSMSVESSGNEHSQKDNLESMTGEIIATILRERVVILESLSSQFETTTSLMVELLQKLVTEGKLEGIFDERGKFIQLSREDRLKIAKAINRRGRVSIGDLAREVNNLISLEPVEETEPESSETVASSSRASS